MPQIKPLHTVLPKRVARSLDHNDEELMIIMGASVFSFSVLKFVFEKK